ncbi:MAG: ABC transporter permease [Actinomycetota bacterium]
MGVSIGGIAAPNWWRHVEPYLAAVALLGVQLIWFGMPAGAWVRGIVLGLLIALLAVGMALVYRANRVINFAQADLGFVPTSLAVGLIVFSGLPYLFGFGVGLAAALALGVVVELAFIRRFRHASRLVLTVATIGITQLLAVLAVLTPRMWGQNAASQRIPAPVDWKLTIGTFILNANDLIALVVAPMAMVAVAWFLGGTTLGTAVRAAAERGDRARLLGIPVGWLSTLVWSIAAGLSFLALFLRAGILGVPLGTALDVTSLVLALSALVIGRLRNLPVVAVTAVSLGLLEYGVSWNASSPLLVTPIVGGFVLLALLAQRRSASRADDDGSSWALTDEVRPLDARTTRLPAVRAMRATIGLLIVLGCVAIPLIMRADQIIKASAVVAFAIVGLSLVVLTGWAGQISLGQMAFVGVGAAVSGKLTLTWNVDLSLSILIAGAAGGLAALVVGLPALRLRGLYLAVTTLVFALAVTSWLLNNRFFEWVPQERLERPPLFGRISVDTPTRYYVYSLVVGVLVYIALRGIRASRTGRAIVALRENERAAQAVAVRPVPAKLTAFVISGVVAGIAGGLYVHLVRSFDIGTYGVQQSIGVFTAAVVGGLGALFGGVLGAVYLRGTGWFITAEEWRLLSSAAGVLLVLLIVPGGLAGLVIQLRDRFVTIVTGRAPGDAPDRGDDPPPLPHLEPPGDARPEPAAETTPISDSAGQTANGATHVTADAADPARVEPATTPSSPTPSSPITSSPSAEPHDQQAAEEQQRT